jgi:hypothetical protein
MALNVAHQLCFFPDDRIFAYGGRRFATGEVMAVSINKDHKRPGIMQSTESAGETGHWEIAFR